MLVNVMVRTGCVALAAFGLLALPPAIAFAKTPTPPAAAKPFNTFADAEALYHAGRYDEAVSAARADGSANARALAARALIAKAVSQTPFDERTPLLKSAEAEADAAIALDANCFEGYMQKLVAFSELERVQASHGEAMKGAAGKSRKLIERALEIDPKNPWALAALGGWHLEIVRRAPIGIGKMMFGASKKDGIAAYDQAVAADPNNALIHYEFGVALLSLDAKKLRPKAEQLFKTTIAIKTEDAFSRFVQKRAEHLLTLVAKGDHDKLSTVLAFYRGETPEPS